MRWASSRFDRRVDAIGPRAHNREGHAARVERALVGGGIDALGQSAGDAEARRPARWRAKSRAVRRPPGVGLRLPTMAS